MKTYLLKAGVRQAIAKAGETDIAVAYNAKTWIDEYPAGNPQLMVTTPGGKRVPVTVEAVDNLITGQVPNELLAGPGVYSYVFVWTSGSTQLESGRCECLVLGSNLAQDLVHDSRRTPEWAERIFLAAEVIEGAIPGMMEARNTTADNAAEAKTAAEAAAESESAAADSAEAAAASEENIDTILTNMEQTITDATAAMNGIEAQKNTMIASIASVAGQGTDTTLTQPGVAADAKAAGDAIGDLKSTVDNGYHRIEADWARGEIKEGVYSDANFRRVATRNPIALKYGDTLKIASGYRYNLTQKASESYITTDWIKQDFTINIPGNYLICIAADPDPSEYITDIDSYVSKLKHTDNAERQISSVIDFIKKYIVPNFEPGKNLFNRETITEGYLLDRNYGILVASPNNTVSDFIRVNSGETIYKRNCLNWYACLFDDDLNYIEPLPNSNDVVIAQDGYIRVTVTKADLETAVISRTYPLPDAADYLPSFIDRSSRKEIEEMSTWSNTVETLVSQMEIRDANYHAAGSIDISQYAFVSLRIGNALGVPCTMNFYDDRISTSSTWMSRPDGSFVSVNIPAGTSIITADDFKELPYMKFLRPIITPSAAPESGTITIQIVGRK